MSEILAELVPLLGQNLVQHIAVLIAMAAVGVPVFAAVHRLLTSKPDEPGAYRRPMRDAVRIGLIIFAFLVLAVMGYLVFNLLAGRYSLSEGVPTTACCSPAKCRLIPQPRDRRLL